MRKSQSLTGNLDWPLLLVYFIIMSLGLATIYSTAYNVDHPSLFSFSEKYGKQIMWIGIANFLGLLVFLIDSDIYQKFSIPIFIATLGLLVLVLFMPPINGARAWIGLGPFGIQPAEFAKIGTAILLARYLSITNIKHQNLNTVFIANAIILIPMVLIILQPDAGSFLVFTAFLFVLYREGVSYDPLILFVLNLIPIRALHFKKTWIGTHFIPILFVIIFLSVITLLLAEKEIELSFLPGTIFAGWAILLVVLFVICTLGYVLMRYMFSKRDSYRALVIAFIGFALSASLSSVVTIGFKGLAPHQKDRIELVLGLKEDPNGKDYNRNRAMAAVGSGGLIGKGYRNATVATVETNHVPESETDFIFCPFAEEWGFAGSAILVFLYIFMILRIVFIAERQKSIFNRVYAYCVAMIIFYHFAINIGMNIEFAPVIGIPLPFFSYGGSSMMSFSIMLFILLKLDSQRKDVLN